MSFFPRTSFPSNQKYKEKKLLQVKLKNMYSTFSTENITEFNINFNTQFKALYKELGTHLDWK